MATVPYGDVSWERMIRAVEAVRERLRRAVTALEQAAIPYAICGGNAVAAWVSRVDEAAVRNTRDVDILLRRADLERAKSALAGAGFIFQHVRGIDMFLDGPRAKARDAVHILFAGEKVRTDDPVSTPEVTSSDVTATGRVVRLEALVQMKLTAFRRKDQVHLTDLLGVGLIDESWPERYPAPLSERLQEIIDTPDG